MVAAAGGGFYSFHNHQNLFILRKNLMHTKNVQHTFKRWVNKYKSDSDLVWQNSIDMHLSIILSINFIHQTSESKIYLYLTILIFL